MVVGILVAILLFMASLRMEEFGVGMVLFMTLIGFIGGWGIVWVAYALIYVAIGVAAGLGIAAVVIGGIVLFVFSIIVVIQIFSYAFTGG
jgi:hypothetical protein